MRAHPSGVHFGRQEPRKFGAKGANVEGVGSQKTRSACPTYWEVGKSGSDHRPCLVPHDLQRSYALGGGKETSRRQAADGDERRVRLAVWTASVVTSGASEGEKAEPVEHKIVSRHFRASTAKPSVSHAAARDGQR